MMANELSKRFLLWFQKENPGARIYRNNRGVAKDQKGNYIRFGIPAPAGKNDNLKGSDFIAFIPISLFVYGGNLENRLTVQFYEIKTAKDALKKGQINFFNMMTEMGAECFVVNEIDCFKGVSVNIKTKKETEYKLNDFFVEKWSLK